MSADLDPEWTPATGYSWRRIGAVIEVRIDLPEPEVPRFELPTIASEGGGAVVEEPGSTRSTAERDVSRNPTTPYDREILERTLVYHWPSQTASCLCGWNELGASFPEHVADMYEANVVLGHACDPRRCCTDCGRHVTPHRGCILR